MLWIVLSMLLAVALAAFVMGIVAIPARRAGRSVLTERGERLFRVGAQRPAAAKSGDAAPTPGEGAGPAPTRRRGQRSTR